MKSLMLLTRLIYNFTYKMYDKISKENRVKIQRRQSIYHKNANIKVYTQKQEIWKYIYLIIRYGVDYEMATI